MKRLAAVLLVAVILFVVLVLVPQLRQPQPATPIVQAVEVVSANPSDLLGSWTSDGEAAWEMTRSEPEMAKRLAGLSPEMAEQFKSIWLANFAANSYQFTADKMTSVVNGVRHVARYTITTTSGNVLTADCVGEQGQAYQLRFAIAGDRLAMTNPTSPDFLSALKRVH
jgi:hypothetical protein